MNFIRQYKYASLQVATRIAQDLIQPNLTLNRLETERRRNEAYESQKPVFYRIEKGEMIVREGGKITPKTLDQLNKLKLEEKERNSFSIVSGLAVLVGLLFIIGVQASKGSFVSMYRGVREMLFLCGTLLLTFILTVPSIYLNQHIGAASPRFQFAPFSTVSPFQSVQ